MDTIQIEIPEQQLVQWIKRLSPASKRRVMQALIPRWDEWEELVDYGSERIRTIATARGKDWNTLTEAQREQLVGRLAWEYP